VRILLLILPALAVGPSVATSQQPEQRPALVDDVPERTTEQAQAGEGRHSREGFWVNAGLGYGSVGCQDCNVREGAFSGGLALGGALSQKLLVGVGTNRWWKSEGGGTLTVGTIAALIRFYPLATGGFFLLGGLGLGTMHRYAPNFGSDTQTGFGAIVGLGLDIRVARNVSLTPFCNGFAVSVTDADANVGQIGLGVTVHSR
jgi:hypothetical protein